MCISNEAMDDIVKNVESLEKSGLLIDDLNETVKPEIKNKGCGFLGAMMVPMVPSLMAPMTSSLMQTVAFSLINAIFVRGVRRAGKGQEAGFLPLLAYLWYYKLCLKSDIIKRIIWIKNFSVAPYFYQYRDY